MTYEPREGVDYIVDLYQVAAVEPSAEIDEIKSAINARSRQYHPDRLEGLAPEFRSKGERMARLLNQARGILLDPEKRSEYDGILEEWDGPVSKDGTPAIRIGDHIRQTASQKTIEELADSVERQRQESVAIFKHDPAQKQMLGTLFESATGDMKEQLRDALDAALLAEDQVLATTETFHAQLLGIDDETLLKLGEDHAETVTLALQSARAEQIEENERRALGGVSARLALLAGATIETAPGTIVPASLAEYGLPAYYDDQAARIELIAKEREAVFERRMELVQPSYPVAELQTTGHNNFVIGYNAKSSLGRISWMSMHFSPESMSLDSTTMPPELRVLLDAGQYEAAYNAGFNVMTFTLREGLDEFAQINEICNKHLVRYFPEAMADDEEDSA